MQEEEALRGYTEGRLFLPAALHPEVLRWGHEYRVTCHKGVQRLLAAIRQQFWWPSMIQDVRPFCSVCSQNKTSNQSPVGLLQPLPIPSLPCSHLALDFVSDHPPSIGNTVIVTVVDCFSKVAHFIPLHKLFSPKETAQVVDYIFWIQRAKQDLERALHCLASHSLSSWSQQLPRVEYFHNSLPVASTGMSPFQCSMGYQPPLYSAQEPEAAVPFALAFVRRCRRTWRRAKEVLAQASRQTKAAADCHRTPAPQYVCV